jgi:S1-C subfamily serine protease
MIKHCLLVVAGIASMAAGGQELFAQPILNRVEQLLRDQVDAARGAGASQQPPAGAQRGYLGLVGDDRDEAGRGVRVLEVVADGPAAKGGVRVGDRITAVDAQPIQDMQDLEEAMDRKAAGEKLGLSVERNGAQRQLSITLGRRAPTVANRNVEELPGPGPALEQASGKKLGLSTVAVTAEARRQNNLSDSKGALVNLITPGMAADRAGIPLGAVITAVDDKLVNSPTELAAAVRRTTADSVELTYWHRGQENRHRVPLVDSGANPAAVPPGPTAQDVPQPQPSDAPTLPASAEERIAQLEARLRDLQVRLEKLETRLTPPAPAAEPEPAREEPK